MRYFYFGHHKCASTWIRLVISEFCDSLGMNYQSLSSGRWACDYNNDLDTWIKDNPYIQFIALASAKRKDLGHPFIYRGFHVIRDPRDIIVSGYYSHLYRKSDPTRQAILAALPIREAMLWEIWDRYWQFKNMYDWPYNELSNIMEVRFEDLIEFPVGVWERILRHLELDIPNWIEILSNLSFEKLSGRARGEEEVGSAYRKGEAGDWKKHLEQDHLDLLDRLYPNLIERLGYEHS